MSDHKRAIRVNRAKRGLSQQALSERCGLSADGIGAIERGDVSPRLETLESIATKGFGLTLMEMLADGTEPAPASVAAQADSDQGSLDPETQSSPASKDATAPRGAQVSATAPTVEANAAGKAA